MSLLPFFFMFSQSKEHKELRKRNLENAQENPLKVVLNIILFVLAIILPIILISIFVN